jgi:hypothetical protein
MSSDANHAHLDRSVRRRLRFHCYQRSRLDSLWTSHRGEVRSLTYADQRTDAIELNADANEQSTDAWHLLPFVTR